jgi:hypothetical protein
MEHPDRGVRLTQQERVRLQEMETSEGLPKRVHSRVMQVLMTDAGQTASQIADIGRKSKLTIRNLQDPVAKARALKRLRRLRRGLCDVETLWGHLEDDDFCRLLAKTAEQFQDEVVNLLEELSKPGGVRRLLKPHTTMKVRTKLRRTA